MNRSGNVFLLIIGLIISSYSKANVSWELLIKKADSLSTTNFLRSSTLCDSLLPYTNNQEPWKGVFLSIRGKANYFKGNYDQAAKDYTSAVQFLSKRNFKKELGAVYIDQAKLYKKIKMYPQAIETYGNAKKIFEELKDESALATVYNEWGGIYEYLNDFDKAIEFYTASLKTRIKFKDSIGMAYSYCFIASASMLKKDYVKAEAKGLQSLGIFKKLNNSFGMAIQSMDLALIYEQKGALEKAIPYLKFCDSIASSFGYIDLQAENYKRLSGIYSKLNNHKLAFEIYKKYVTIKDSLFNTNSQKNIAELYVNYKTAEKDMQLLQQENKNNKQKITLILIGSLLVIVIVFAYFIYRSRKLKEEKLKLEAQNTLQNDRLRISRDLHDNIGANLTYINNAVQSINNEEKQVENLKTLLNETIIELRRTVWLINKPSVKLDEWIVKLREYYLKINEVKLRILLIENEDSILTSKQATNLFRVIQEATNNSFKHANASSINVTIQTEHKTLIIKIEDNGKGFEESSITHGFGLSNMRQNMLEIGGTISIESQINKGTIITLKYKL